MQISTGFASSQRYCTAPSSGRQPNFAALNRERHLCSAGRPSRWALAHISFCDLSLKLPVIRFISSKMMYFWATVYKTVRPMLWDRCHVLSVCPVCDVGVLRPTVGWIKTKLGPEVGLGPGHIVLDGDPAPNFRPMSVVAKRLMDEDATWYGGRPQPRRHCVRWGPRQKRAQHPPLNFWPMYCGQTATWIKMPLGMEVDLGPGHIVRWAPPTKGHGPLAPIFGPCLLWSNGWIDQNATWLR